MLTPEQAGKLTFSINDLPEAAFITDANHVIVSINPAALKLLEYTAEELVGWPLDRIFPAPPHGISLLMADGNGSTKFEIKMRTKSGAPALMSFMAMPEKRDGQIVGMLYLGRDIRLRKLVEGEIRKARDYFRAIIQDSPNGICVTNLQRVVVMANKVAADLAGYSVDELIGNPVSVYYPKTVDIELDIEALRRGEKISREVNLTHKDGTTTPVLAYYRLLEDEHGEQMIIESYGDLTDRKRLDRLKNEFVYIAAHELRNPVSAIRLLLNFIFEDKRVTLEPVLRDYLLKMQEADDRLMQLVDDLLEVSRSESGRLKIEVSPQDMTKHVDAIFSENRPAALTKGVELRHEPLHSMPPVMADPNKLKEILANLISNGVKYGVPGGALVVSHELRDGFLATSVTDNGIGISESDIAKLFEKFWRSEDNAVRAQAGTGLGLFIVKELVTRMGGHVDVKSVIGKGTTFTFTLPLAK